MVKRRNASSSSKSNSEVATKHTRNPSHGHTHDHSHESSESEHKHSHSLFGGHSHGEEGNHGAEQVISALQGSGDRGSRITLIGLFSNIILTAAKGGAGWYMHSASLLADAGHSLSDLLGDFIVLFCWKLSRKPPTPRYPYGFAKYETLGTTIVSILLVGGALGIGGHSFGLLAHALEGTLETIPAGPLHSFIHNLAHLAHHLPSIGHSHSHSHTPADGSVLDPNAAWFAVIGILTKEWLYRITAKVAKEENSPVLLANAVHHRSDAYSSIVALAAILGSWYWPALPLDPIGGLLVSLVILQQGIAIFRGAWGQLIDRGVSDRTIHSLQRSLNPLLVSSTFPERLTPPQSPTSPPAYTTSMAYDPPSPSPILIAISALRARRAGSLIFVDLTAEVEGSLSVRDTSELEEKITGTLKNARREVGEVRVRFVPRALGEKNGHVW